MYNVLYIKTYKSNNLPEAVHYMDFTRVKSDCCFILTCFVLCDVCCVQSSESLSAGDCNSSADGVCSSRTDRDEAKISSVCVL